MSNNPVVVVTDPTLHSRHDVFNILGLPLVILFNVLYLSSTPDLYAAFFVIEDDVTAMEQMSNTPSPKYYWAQFFSFIIYLGIDTIWLFFYPRSVQSPSQILLHHAFCLLGFTFYLCEDDRRQLAFFCSIALSVEFNTWFLILRRNVKSNVIINLFFFVSWIALRVVLYPLLLFQTALKTIYLFSIPSKATASFYGFHWLFIFLLTFFLNGLNLEWTVKLISNNIKHKIDKGL